LSDSILRTTTKTITYRLAGSGLTFILAYIFTGEIIISASISIAEFLLKPMFYWIHERVWNTIKWGKNKE
jgi:uncharacterized membrane protein